MIGDGINQCGMRRTWGQIYIPPAQWQVTKKFWEKGTGPESEALEQHTVKPGVGASALRSSVRQCRRWERLLLPRPNLRFSSNRPILAARRFAVSLPVRKTTQSGCRIIPTAASAAEVKSREFIGHQLCSRPSKGLERQARNFGCTEKREPTLAPAAGEDGAPKEVRFELIQLAGRTQSGEQFVHSKLVISRGNTTPS